MAVSVKSVFLKYIDLPERVFYHIENKLNEFASSITAFGEGYDYTAVAGTTATIAFINVVFQTVGCQNTAETTITLPSIGTVGKMEITIKDEALNNSSGNLIITPDGSDTVEGETSLTLIRSGDQIGISITLYNNNSNKWFIK